MAYSVDVVSEYYKDKDLSLLKKLTLVIPTYNRNYYLSRCLWYHAHFPFGQIIVADSSPEEKKVVNRETVVKIRDTFGANILYLEYEPETETFGEDIYRKWADAVQHVKTEFVKICTDREFILPEVVSDCILFLDAHSDYATTDGKSVILTVNPEDSHNRKVQGWVPLDKSFEDNNPLERIEDMLQNSSLRNGAINTLTAVRRTSFQKYIYDCLEKYSLNDIRFGDLVPQYLSVLCFKRKHFNSPYLIRDSSYIQNMRKISSYERYPYIDTYGKMGLLSSKEKSLYQLTIDILQSLNYSYSKITSDDEKKIEQLIHDFIQVFFQIGMKHWCSKIYLSLPKELQKHIRCLYSLFIHESVEEETEDIAVVSKIIYDTKSYYYSDSPICFDSVGIFKD